MEAGRLFDAEGRCRLTGLEGACPVWFGTTGALSWSWLFFSKFGERFGWQWPTPPVRERGAGMT